MFREGESQNRSATGASGEGERGKGRGSRLPERRSRRDYVLAVHVETTRPPWHINDLCPCQYPDTSLGPR